MSEVDHGTDEHVEPIRVVVADDQRSVRDGLVLMLDLFADITVVVTAADGVEALTLVERHRPDVVLVDLHMPVLDGIATIRRLTRDHPGVNAVVLTTYADNTSIIDALRAGARGYLTKNAERAGIGVRAAAHGQSVLDPAVQTTLVDATHRAPQPEAPAASSSPTASPSVRARSSSSSPEGSATARSPLRSLSAATP